VSDTAGCYAQDDIELYYSPVNLGSLDNYSLFSGDSIIVSDTGTIENIAGATNYVSDNVYSFKETQIGGAEISSALADMDSLMIHIEPS
jgi:hypothetical protein